MLVFRGVEGRVEADANECRLTAGCGRLCGRATERRSDGGRHEVVNNERIILYKVVSVLEEVY